MSNRLPRQPLLVLGIDPGSRRTGYAYIQRDGRTLAAVQSGTLSLGASKPISARLGLLLERLEELFSQLRPTVLAVEDIFTAKSPKSALLLGQARGVPLALAGKHGVPVHAYAPATVKRAVAGHGAAGKPQIQQMVRRLLNLDQLPQADEADAMAIAICHCLASKAKEI